MPTGARWISAETEQKERHFRGLQRTHAGICKGIFAKLRSPLPYLYIDLNGGRGNLEYKGRVFPGSPLIAREELDTADLPYRALHFECVPSEADLLEKALADRGWPPGSVQRIRFEEGVPLWLDGLGRREAWRFGLVYSDPINDPIPVATFNLIAARLPRVDLLSYVSATNQYKRANANGAGHGRRLAEDVQAVNKRYALIREPRRAEQYTFILWSNWDQLFDWKREGFYRLDSGRGQEILTVADNTIKELHDKRNTPLPLPPYRTYAEYLKHPRFLAIRAQVFERAGGVCERCGERPPTEPHHLSYPPWGTFDVAENLVAVCHPCHCRAHGKER